MSETKHVQNDRVNCRVGGSIDDFSVCLRVYGKEVVPSEITRMSGAVPTYQHSLGDRISNRSENLRSFGMWHMERCGSAPAQICDLIEQVLSELPASSEFWEPLRKLGKLDLYCSVRIRSENRGFSLPVATMQHLAERGIEFAADIWCETDDAT